MPEHLQQAEGAVALLYYVNNNDTNTLFALKGIIISFGLKFYRNWLQF